MEHYPWEIDVTRQAKQHQDQCRSLPLFEEMKAHCCPVGL